MNLSTKILFEASADSGGLFHPRRLESREQKKMAIIQKMIDKDNAKNKQLENEFQSMVSDPEFYYDQEKQKLIKNKLASLEKRKIHLQQLQQKLEQDEKNYSDSPISDSEAKKQSNSKDIAKKWVAFYNNIKGGNQLLHFKDLMWKDFIIQARKFNEFLKANKLKTDFHKDYNGWNLTIKSSRSSVYQSYTSSDFSFMKMRAIGGKNINVISFDGHKNSEYVGINFFDDEETEYDEPSVMYKINKITYNQLIAYFIRDCIRNKVKFEKFIP